MYFFCFSEFLSFYIEKWFANLNQKEISNEEVFIKCKNFEEQKFFESFINELAEYFENKFFVFEKDDLKETFKKNVYGKYKLIPFNDKDLFSH